MAMVRRIANEGDSLSEESVARLAALEGRPIDISDIPEANPEELKEMAQILRGKRKKQMFSLRLANETILWWRRLGEGYTGVMARLLEEAKNHPEWIKICL